MRKTSTKEIGGLEWRTKMLPATQGINVFTVVTRIIGSTLAQGMSLATSATSVGDLDFASIGQAVDQLFARMGPDQLATLAKDLLACTEVRNEAGDWQPVPECFDDVFAGKYRTLADVCRWAFEVNFDEVFSFSVIAEKFKAAMAAQERSTSRKRSGKHAAR